VVRAPATGKTRAAVRRERRRRAVDCAAAAAWRRPGRSRQPRPQPVLPGHGHTVPADDGRGAGGGVGEVCALVVSTFFCTLPCEVGEGWGGLLLRRTLFPLPLPLLLLLSLLLLRQPSSPAGTPPTR